MNFSMDGFRTQLSHDTKALRDIARDIINDDFYDKEDFVEAVNHLIRHSNIINCVYLKDGPSFRDMSDLVIDYLELDEECSE